MNESPHVLAETASESVVMTQGNGVHALPNSWQQITPRAITDINHAGQRRYWRNSDGLCNEAPSNPKTTRLLSRRHHRADGHLDRWRGNALARLGDPDAIDHLAHALDHLPADFVRARAGLLVDLAYAHAAAGNRDATRTYARDARRLALQIKSDRHLHRLGQLVLPGAA